MILSDGLVKEKMKYKLIQIEPEPTEESWQGMTLDGHLSKEFYKIKWKAAGGVRIAIDLEDYDTKEFANKYWEPIELTSEGYFPIHPGEFRLAYTKEKLRLTQESRVCAFVEGKSSLARIGLAIHLAPIIHCGFKEEDKPDPIMLELYNHSKNVIYLRPDTKICQFCFASVDGDFLSKGAKGLGAGQLPRPTT